MYQTKVVLQVLKQYDFLKNVIDFPILLTKRFKQSSTKGGNFVDLFPNNHGPL